MTLGLVSLVAGSLTGLVVLPAVWLIAFPEDIKARVETDGSKFGAD